MSITKLSASQKQEALSELSAIAEEFGSIGMQSMSAEVSGLMAEMNAAAAEGGFGPASLGGGSFEAMGLGQNAELDAFFFNWIKDKVAGLIRKITELVRRYGHCTTCIPKVTNAIRLFNSKNYPAALAAAYDAFNCINNCIRNS